MKSALVIGFSARALAESLKRAGYSPLVIDCCGDRDTRLAAFDFHAACDLADRESLIKKVEQWQARHPIESVYFAGGIENQWDLLSDLCDRFTTLPSLDAWRSMRNWKNWERWASGAGMRFPATVDWSDLFRFLTGFQDANRAETPFSDLDLDAAHPIPKPLLAIAEQGEKGGEWLIKSLLHSGGLGLEAVEPLSFKAIHSGFSRCVYQWLTRISSESRLVKIPQANASQPISRTNGLVLQRKMFGRSLGVSFFSKHGGAFSREESGSTFLIGATYSIEHAPHPWTDFIYRGSEGPVPLDRDRVESLMQLAKTVVRETGWRGFWQADFLDTAEGLVLLEINPRWSSSMELHATSKKLPMEKAFSGDALSDFQLENEYLQNPSRARIGPWIRKEIVYSDSDCSVTEQDSNALWEVRLQSDLSKLSAGERWIADIPMPHTEMGKGYPLCSLFVAEENANACLSAMRSFRERLAAIAPNWASSMLPKLRQTDISN